MTAGCDCDDQQTYRRTFKSADCGIAEGKSGLSSEEELGMRGLILGGGVTGLAAGVASAFPIFEATEVPGGICSSYYMRPGDHQRLMRAPAGADAYRFEIGGGH